MGFFRGIPLTPIMENQMEKQMENEMETREYIGLLSLGFRVQDFGFYGLGFRV